MSADHRRLNRLGAAMLAGSVAIVLNTLALAAAGLFHLETAHGGLLRLMVSSLPSSVDRLGIASTWAAMNGPPISSKSFQTGFHLFVGLLMALFYAFVLEPFLPPSTAAKGWIYAIGGLAYQRQRRLARHRRRICRQRPPDRRRHPLVRGFAYPVLPGARLRICTAGGRAKAGARTVLGPAGRIRR